MAATNKCLAKSNKSYTAGKATKRRLRQCARPPSMGGRRAHTRETAGMKPILCAAPVRTGSLAPAAVDDSRPMTLEEAKSIARHLGLTLRKVRSGDYRVSFRDGSETAAYYSDDLEDAVNAAVKMARKRTL